MAAAERYRHAFDRSGLAQRLVEGAGDLCGECRGVAVLRFAVEGHVHQVVVDLLADLGAQGDLVVARFVGLGAEAEQSGGADNEGSGKTG